MFKFALISCKTEIQAKFYVSLLSFLSLSPAAVAVGSLGPADG